MVAAIGMSIFVGIDIIAIIVNITIIIAVVTIIVTIATIAVPGSTSLRLLMTIFVVFEWIDRLID